MASKKDKILESAQRFVLKGQIDKAIKDYQQVVALEPGDIRYRQRLAELLVRDNRKDEAIQQYEDIGKHYSDNSYYLKAIAIYKQIQRLSPGNLDIALTIASLNHQQGLIGNAMAEYGQVAAQYEKEGALKEALKVVEKMLGVDAEHAATRLKYAELLYATGAKERSREVFNELSGTLRSRGKSDEAASVAARAQELFPDEEEELSLPESAELSLNGFDASEDIPGVEAPAASYQETPVQEPLLPDWDAPAAELPDPFAAPATATEPESAAVADAAGESAFEAPAPWDADEVEAEAEGSIAWEEEIELDLDDDMFGAAPSAEPVPPVSEDAGVSFPEPAAAVEAAPPGGEIELPLDFSLELDFDEVEGESDEVAPEQQGSAQAVELELEQEEELELTFPDEGAPFGDFSWSDAEEGLPDEPEQPEAAAPELEGIEEVELELGPEPEPAAEEDSANEGRGWEEIFPAAVEGAELDLAELESHYDLGIGYKEMGMYAGAIKEFDVAAGNPQRRFDCLTLQAICYRDKGEPDKAEELLRRGLSLGVISRDERTCLNYELAVLLEAKGAADEAIELYREVMRANPAYQDASDRLSALSGEEPLDIIDLELEEGA